MLIKNWMFLFLLFVPLFCFSQDYYTKYEELMAQGQINKIPSLLEFWEKENPKDENVYITGFNHYLTMSRQENIINAISTDSTNESDLIQSEVIYNDSLFQMSQDYIQKGIILYPKRLDLHLGKIHALWMKGEHRLQTGEILGLIELGDKIKQDWSWRGKKIESPQVAFTSSVYEYVANLFASEQYTYVKQISERMIKSFPKEVASYSNLGAIHKLEGKYRKAIRCFKKAIKIRPNDIIVLNNMAETYDFMGKPKKALKYYRLMVEHGNQQEQQFAKDKMQNIYLRLSAE